MDATTRLTWVEVTKDLTALTVMFASLKAVNILTMEYDIRFQEILSDHGAEFGQKTSNSKQKHHTVLKVNTEFRFGSREANISERIRSEMFEHDGI